MQVDIGGRMCLWCPDMPANVGQAVCHVPGQKPKLSHNEVDDRVTTTKQPLSVSRSC